MNHRQVIRIVIACFLSAFSLIGAKAFGQIQSEIPLQDVINLELPSDERGQITLEPSALWAIIELRHRDAKSNVCAGVSGGALAINGTSYESTIGSPGEGWLGVGYHNWESEGRRRCREADSTVFHGVVRFNTEPLSDALERARSRMGTPRVAMRINSVTLGASRIPGPQPVHRRCVVGRGAPLQQVLIRHGGAEGVTSDDLFVSNRPDMRLVRFQHDNYINLDGEDIGYREAVFRSEPTTTRDEVQDSGGSVRLFYAGVDTTLNSLNRLTSSGGSGFPEWVTLLSVENKEFGSNKNCLAVYGEFRLNVTYEYVATE